MYDDLPRTGICMVRPTLADLPETRLPAPFAIRPYRPGDERAWRRILELSDRYNKITPTFFAEQFGRDERELRARQLYLCEAAGEPVGTITAWHNAHYPDRRYGRVHWVSIVPRHHGKGLGKPLMGACLRRMIELGCEGAYLTTDPRRVPAINLYLRYGFLPDVRSDQEREGWRLLADRVKGEFRHTVAAAAGGSG